MDDVLYALFFTPPILGGANVLLAVLAQQRLLRELREISTERHMLKFKQFAATQMCHALFHLAAGAVAMMTAGYAWLGAHAVAGRGSALVPVADDRCFCSRNTGEAAGGESKETARFGRTS